jgi:hypothetical protein
MTPRVVTLAMAFITLSYSTHGKLLAVFAREIRVINMRASQFC